MTQEFTIAADTDARHATVSLPDGQTVEWDYDDPQRAGRYLLVENLCEKAESEVSES